MKIPCPKCEDGKVFAGYHMHYPDDVVDDALEVCTTCGGSGYHWSGLFLLFSNKIDSLKWRIKFALRKRGDDDIPF